MLNPLTSSALLPYRRLLKHAVWRLTYRSTDLERGAQRQANADSAALVETAMPMATPHKTPTAVLSHALSVAPEHGCVAEFGVYSGATLREIAARRPGAHGFDSFEGLPEAWRYGHGEGAWSAGLIPQVEGAELHKGWFEDTVPNFVKTLNEPAAFLHLDADLYSSTKSVLEAFEGLIVPGTVLLFDEYFNYPGWRNHEHRAFMEFVQQNNLSYEYFAYNTRGEQVAVRIL